MTTLQTALANTIYERYETRVLNQLVPGSGKAAPPMLSVATRAETRLLIREALGAMLCAGDRITASSLGACCEALLAGCGLTQVGGRRKLAEIVSQSLAVY